MRFIDPAPRSEKCRWSDQCAGSQNPYAKSHSRLDAGALLFANVRVPLLFVLSCCALGPSAVLAQVHLTVSRDGTAQYSTVQSAVDAVPANNTQRYVIDIGPGTYVESIRVPSNKPFITFSGSSAGNTVLTYNLGASDPPNDPLVHASTGI